MLQIACLLAADMLYQLFTGFTRMCGREAYPNESALHADMCGREALNYS